MLACVAWRFCRAGRRSSVAAKFAREARENERRSREKKLLPPQSPRGFSALARLYYLARPTKTAMLRRLLICIHVWPNARKEGRKEMLNPLNSLIRLDTGQGFIGVVDLSGRDSCTFLRCMWICPWPHLWKATVFCRITGWKVIQDSLGLWIALCGFRNSGIRFRVIPDYKC